jgi:hypothetical protein
VAPETAPQITVAVELVIPEEVSPAGVPQVVVLEVVVKEEVAIGPDTAEHTTCTCQLMDVPAGRPEIKTEVETELIDEAIPPDGV